MTACGMVVTLCTARPPRWVSIYKRLYNVLKEKYGWLERCPPRMTFPLKRISSSLPNTSRTTWTKSPHCHGQRTLRPVPTLQDNLRTRTGGTRAVPLCSGKPTLRAQSESRSSEHSTVEERIVELVRSMLERAPEASTGSCSSNWRLRGS